MKLDMRKCSVIAVWCLIAAALVHAQSINGRISGTVTDVNGAAIPKAAVTVTNEGTGGERRIEADEDGTFVIAELPVGFYTV